MPPVGRGGDAPRRKVGFPWRIGPVAPLDASPRARRQRIPERADADRFLIGPAFAAIARSRLLAIDPQRASARCPTHTATATDAVFVGRYCCPRIRRRPPRRSASRRPLACGAPGSRPDAISLESGPSRESAPPRSASDPSSTLRADTVRLPWATRAAASRAPRSRPLGSWPPCPAPRSTAAPRRPNAAPISENWFRRGAGSRYAPGSPLADVARRPRRPTAHA